MIKPNMKVGDIFTDGNRTFKVLQVLGEGLYHSQVISGGTEPEEEATEPIEEEKPKRKRVAKN